MQREPKRSAAARGPARRRRPARRSPAPHAGEAAGAATRERILIAALQVFAERGFEGARTREIAERASANLGLIPYYFGGKEPLWRAAVARAFAELVSEIGDDFAAPARESREQTRERLERLLRRFVRFVSRRPEFMRLMNDEGKRDGPRMRWLADRFVRPMSEGLARLFARAQAQGVLPAVPIPSLHYIALGAAGLLFSQAPECARVTGVDATSEAIADAHADALVRILLPPANPARRSRGMRGDRQHSLS